MGRPVGSRALSLDGRLAAEPWLGNMEHVSIQIQ